MHDLEQRAQQLVRDWKVLRQGLERIQRDQRLGQFYAMHLDGIEASLVEVPELVYCIVTDIDIPGTADGTAAPTPGSTRSPRPPSRDGFAALIRRTRQTVEDIDMDD